MRAPDNKLNRLERKAVNGEDARWQQAKEIVRRLDAEETEREIASTWINGNTGKPYDHVTVERFAKAWREFGAVPHQGDRPAFWKATEQASGSSTRIQRNEAQPPKTIKSAEKLVENLIEKAPPEVIEAVQRGLGITDGDKATKTTTAPRPKLPSKSLFDHFAKGAWEIRDFAERLKDEMPEPDDYEPMRRLLAATKATIDWIEASLEEGQPIEDLKIDWDAFEREVAELVK